MAEGRSGCGDRARLGSKRHRGGFVMLKLPRHVIPKRPASGKTAFYYNVPSKYRALNCPVRNEPLGTDYAEMVRRAETLNGIFDEWDQQRKGLPISAELMPKYGTVDWLFREYKISKAYLEKVAPRSRQNYEWAMREVCDTLTKKGDRVGGRLVKTISPRGADKLYDLFIKRAGSKGERLRTGEKMVLLCRKACRVVRRLFPDEFPKDVPNPWVGVTMKNRVKLIKAAVTRDQVLLLCRRTPAWRSQPSSPCGRQTKAPSLAPAPSRLLLNFDRFSNLVWLLQRNYLVVASHHGDGPKFQPLC